MSVRLISRCNVATAVRYCADHLNDLQPERPILILYVLNGAVFFATKLCKQLTIPYYMEAVKVTSYEGQSQKPPQVTFLSDNFQDTHIWIVDELYDTGVTLKAISDQLVERYKVNPAFIHTMVALRKMKMTTCPEPNVTGLDGIPDVWLYGFWS